MTNDQLKYGVGGILIGGIIVWFVMSSANNSGFRGMMMGQRFDSQNQTINSGVMDAHFIEQMIPHHEDAITMAELALTKAQHPEIKQLSEAIIESQGKEIEQMKAWYQEWYERDVPIGTQGAIQAGMMGGRRMNMGMMGNQTDIQRLEQASDFDRIFIEEMIPHHQMAVMMANMLKQGTQRPEMKQLANDIISAQTREIEQMRQWYSTWF